MGNMDHVMSYDVFLQQNLSSEFRISLSVLSVYQIQKQVPLGECFVPFHVLLMRWIAQQVFVASLRN